MPPADAVPRSDPSPEPVDTPPQVPSPRSAPAAERALAPTAERASIPDSERALAPAAERALAPTAERASAPAAEPTGGQASVDGDEPAGAVRAGARPSVDVDELSERELRILAFELQWWRHAGAKEQAIRDTFGLSATRYYQLLNGLLDRPAALVAEPLLIGRLRRLRASRARNRRR
ncbi:DUF3263 domain-containing protein [Micromonospora sp. NPDC048894]|uniref:DUF3263 domain-containing protein n=1 Tax=unclassified Micromonospora TaxID=2617518 RepID=UPI0033DF2B06